MVFRNLVFTLDGAAGATTPPDVVTYPTPGADRVYQDVVAKVTFSRPVRGLDERSFTLTDSTGAQIPAWVDQIGDSTFGLFPNQVLLKGGETYQARLAAGVCDTAGVCTKSETTWKFTVAKEADQGSGNTGVPVGFVMAAAAPSAIKQTTRSEAAFASEVFIWVLR